MMPSKGVQQDDPLGPLLFWIVIYKLCNKLKSEFSTFYFDDGRLGGNGDDVINDLVMIDHEASALGLQFNHKKSELN